VPPPPARTPTLPDVALTTAVEAIFEDVILLGSETTTTGKMRFGGPGFALQDRNQNNSVVDGDLLFMTVQCSLMRSESMRGSSLSITVLQTLLFNNVLFNVNAIDARFFAQGARLATVTFFLCSGAVIASLS
jgi:hypothetical protein